MRTMGTLAIVACGVVLLVWPSASAPAAQLFAPVGAPADLRSPAAYGAAVAPVYLEDPAAMSFQLPGQPSEGQHNAAAFLAGAAVLAAVCCRTRAPSAVAMAAVDGRDDETSQVLSRRMMLAGLAASPIFAARAARAVPEAKPIWAVRKGAIDKPESVKKGCNVEKPCNKGAVFPLSVESDKEEKARFAAAVDKFKSRQPKEAESS